MKKVAIIGAGISGLSTANAVERLAAAAGIDVAVTVFEREERTGGKIWSIREEGYLCEWGPKLHLQRRYP
jgi:oxygen-dependent protoporphyrinogen oxidase